MFPLFCRFRIQSVLGKLFVRNFLLAKKEHYWSEPSFCGLSWADVACLTSIYIEFFELIFFVACSRFIIPIFLPATYIIFLRKAALVQSVRHSIRIQISKCSHVWKQIFLTEHVYDHYIQNFKILNISILSSYTRMTVTKRFPIGSERAIWNTTV